MILFLSVDVTGRHTSLKIKLAKNWTHIKLYLFPAFYYYCWYHACDVFCNQPSIWYKWGETGRSAIQYKSYNDSRDLAQTSVPLDFQTLYSLADYKWLVQAHRLHHQLKYYKIEVSVSLSVGLIVFIVNQGDHNFINSSELYKICKVCLL